MTKEPPLILWVTHLDRRTLAAYYHRTLAAYYRRRLCQTLSSGILLFVKTLSSGVLLLPATLSTLCPVGKAITIINYKQKLALDMRT